MANTINFDCNKAVNGEVQIVVLADVHLGNEYFDESYFKAVVDYIEQTPNCYFLCNGDLIENSITNAPSGVYSDTMHPDSQITMICYYLSKIVAQGKCINMTIGNHEFRSSKHVGINPMDRIVSDLSKYDPTLPERYYPAGVYTFINIPCHNSTCCFIAYNQHGVSGGSTLTGAIGKSVKQKAIVNAHLVIRSHTHKAYAIPTLIMSPDTHQHTIKEEKSWLISNGAFLNYWGGYGEMVGYEPQDTSTPIIYLKAIRNKFVVNGKRKEVIDKNSNVILRDKTWFLEQVRDNKKKPKKKK